MAPRSPDFIHVDFWLWSYLNSLVCRSVSSILMQPLIDAIQQTVSGIHPHMCSAVTGVATRLTFSIKCDGAHVEQLKLK